MAATNSTEPGLNHPTVVPANHVPEQRDNTGTSGASGEESTPLCPACGRPLDDH